MRNLCFTERSLQFSRIALKSLGSPISLSSLSVLPLSLASLSFSSSTGGASSWELFPCLPPSPPPGDGAGAQAALGERGADGSARL
jgi:hypothetical protein